MKGLDLSAPFRQLVERRLWPLAVLLLAGLAAVPLVLAKDGAPPAPPATASPAAAAVASTAATQPVVAVADAAQTERRRNVLGARKDPFRPAKGPKAEKADVQTVSAPTPTATGAPGGESGGAAAPDPLSGLPVGSLPTAPKKVYELYSLTVRFGDSTSDTLAKTNLKRLKAMPDSEDPVLIYLGLMKDRRTAVFLVDALAEVQGDGRCLPSADNCQTVELEVGETAFFDVTTESGEVVQYQLDLVRVAKKKTSDASAARRGRATLRAELSTLEGYRFDSKSGTIERADDD